MPAPSPRRFLFVFLPAALVAALSVAPPCIAAPDLVGSEQAVSEKAGSGSIGSEEAAAEPTGPDPAGSQPAGSKPTGSEASGSQQAAPDPTATPPSAAEADALIQKQDWGAAATAYEAIARAHPEDGLAWFRLGSARHSLGEYAAAAEAWLKAAEIGGNPVVPYNLACAYARMGEKAKAFEWLDKSIAAGLTRPEAMGADPDLASLKGDPEYEKILDKARRAAKPCAYRPEARQFDFWIGEWDVVTTKGSQPAGTSSVELILGDCVIFENWTSRLGGSGKSFNLFNAIRGRWEQTWVNDRGGVTEYRDGRLEGNALSFVADTARPDGTPQKQRLTFENLGPDRVRQHGETSTDGGATWSPSFDLTYLRKK